MRAQSSELISPNGLHQVDAGRIDQAVQAPKRSDDALDGRRDLRLARDVGSGDGDLMPLVAQT